MVTTKSVKLPKENVTVLCTTNLVNYKQTGKKYRLISINNVYPGTGNDMAKCTSTMRALEVYQVLF